MLSTARRPDLAQHTAEAVVIGGGVNGTSTAFHLASMGVKDVILVERRQLAAGATGKSGALVRMHYTNAIESQMAVESLKVFLNFREAVGGDCGWDSPGFVQLVAPGYEEKLRHNIADQQRLGVETTVLTPQELK